MSVCVKESRMMINFDIKVNGVNLKQGSEIKQIKDSECNYTHPSGGRESPPAGNCEFVPAGPCDHLQSPPPV